jgi:hypothetical protein
MATNSPEPAPSLSRARSGSRSNDGPQLQPIWLDDNNIHNEVRDGHSPPLDAVNTAERWNEPRRNMWGFYATFTSFLVLGLNDASPGVLADRI